VNTTPGESITIGGAAIPEPASAALLFGAAAAGMIACRRSRRVARRFAAQRSPFFQSRPLFGCGFFVHRRPPALSGGDRLFADLASPRQESIIDLALGFLSICERRGKQTGPQRASPLCELRPVRGEPLRDAHVVVG